MFTYNVSIKKIEGSHVTGLLRPPPRKHWKTLFWGRMWFLLKKHCRLPLLVTTEDALPCLLAHQTQFKMWFRSWRNNTWKRSGAPWRSSGSCMSGSWSSFASSSLLRGSTRAAAPSAWPTAARPPSRR